MCENTCDIVSTWSPPTRSRGRNPTSAAGGRGEGALYRGTHFVYSCKRVARKTRTHLRCILTNDEVALDGRQPLVELLPGLLEPPADARVDRLGLHPAAAPHLRHARRRRVGRCSARVQWVLGTPGGFCSQIISGGRPAALAAGAFPGSAPQVTSARRRSPRRGGRLHARGRGYQQTQVSR